MNKPNAMDLGGDFMLSLAICTLNNTITETVMTLIRKHIIDNDIHVSVNVYHQSVDIIPHSRNIDILIMEIDKNNVQNLEALKKIKIINANMVLILVSEVIDFACLGYRVDAFRYELLNEFDRTFTECMQDALDKIGINKPSITVEFVDGTATVYYDDIVFLESKNHVVYFHINSAVNSVRYLYQKLDYFASVLPVDTFSRIHKSYIVNMKYVERIAYNTAYLVTEEALSISQRRYAQVRQQFKNLVS